MILNISVKNNKIVNRIASTTIVMRIGLCLTIRVLCSWMGFGDWQEDSSEWSLPTWILVLYCAKALQTLPIIERELGRVLQLQCHSGLELRLKKKKSIAKIVFNYSWTLWLLALPIAGEEVLDKGSLREEKFICLSLEQWFSTSVMRPLIFLLWRWSSTIKLLSLLLYN